MNRKEISFVIGVGVASLFFFSGLWRNDLSLMLLGLWLLIANNTVIVLDQRKGLE